MISHQAYCDAIILCTVNFYTVNGSLKKFQHISLDVRNIIIMAMCNNGNLQHEVRISCHNLCSS